MQQRRLQCFSKQIMNTYLTRKHVTEQILPLNAGTLRILSAVKLNTLITHPINFIAWYAPGPLSGDGQGL